MISLTPPPDFTYWIAELYQLAFDWLFGPILASLYSREKSDIRVDSGGQTLGVDSGGQTSEWILEEKISDNYI